MQNTKISMFEEGNILYFTHSTLKMVTNLNQSIS